MSTTKGFIRALPVAAGVAALAVLIHGGAVAQRGRGERKPGLTIEYQGPGEAQTIPAVAPPTEGGTATIERAERAERPAQPENPIAAAARRAANRDDRHRGPGWNHGDIVDIGGRRYDYYYAPSGGLTVYAETPDNKVVYDVVERSRRDWVAGHYEEVKVEEEIEGQTVPVFHPAVYARQSDGTLKLLEEERTDTVPKTRMIVTHRWVEGAYAYGAGKAGDAPMPEKKME